MGRYKNRLRDDERVIEEWLAGEGGTSGAGYVRRDGRLLLGRAELHYTFAPVASLNEGRYVARVTMGENLLNQETHEWLLGALRERSFNLYDAEAAEALHDGQRAERVVEVEVMKRSLLDELVARRPMSDEEFNRRYREVMGLAPE